MGPYDSDPGFPPKIPDRSETFFCRSLDYVSQPHLPLHSPPPLARTTHTLARIRLRYNIAAALPKGFNSTFLQNILYEKKYVYCKNFERKIGGVNTFWQSSDDMFSSAFLPLVLIAGQAPPPPISASFSSSVLPVSPQPPTSTKSVKPQQQPACVEQRKQCSICWFTVPEPMPHGLPSGPTATRQDMTYYMVPLITCPLQSNFSRTLGDWKPE